MTDSPLVTASDLHFRYHRRANSPWTLDNINLTIAPGACVGIVGETGSGKSTLIRILCGLLRPTTGTVTVAGRPLTDWLTRDPREFRQRNQMLFQSPASSLDPRMRIRQSLAEPVKAIERRTPTPAENIGWLDRVGLNPDVLDSFPHQLSGGQLQRIGLARALSVQPTTLYADEPTSALDVSVQAQVLNLLLDLRTQLGITLVMVSHDLAVISRLCEEIIVMHHGQIIETGPTVDVLANPQTDYTAALIEAAEAVSLHA